MTKGISKRKASHDTTVPIPVERSMMAGFSANMIDSEFPTGTGLRERNPYHTPQWQGFNSCTVVGGFGSVMAGEWQPGNHFRFCLLELYYELRRLNRLVAWKARALLLQSCALIWRCEKHLLVTIANSLPTE